MAFGLVRRDKAQIDVEINGKPVKKNLAEMQGAYRKLSREIRTLTVGSKEFIEKSKQLGKLKNEIDDARGAMNKFGKSQGAIAKGFRFIGGAIKTAFSTLFPLLAISEAFNLGKEMFLAAKATEELTAKLNTLTGATGDDLDQLVISAKALDKTFQDAEIESILDAAKGAAFAFNKEGEALGDTYKETFKNIELGLLAVVDGKGQEFLEQVKEYSVQLEQLGLTQSQAFSLIAEGINQGVFDDKAPDTVKELALRLEDLTKGQKDVLAQNFGKQFAEDVDSGKIKTIDALGQIATGLKQIDSQGGKVKPVISNLFGGAGEDAGDKFIFSLSSINTELTDLIDTSNVYVRQQLEQLEANRQLAEAEQSLSFAFRGSGNALTVLWAKVQTAVINRISKIVETIRYFPEYLRAATSSFSNFGNTIKIVFNQILSSIEELLAPFNFVFEKIFGKEIKLPKFTIDDTNNPFKEVEKKIQADRQAFVNEQQRQQAIETDKQAAFQRQQEAKAQAARAKALKEQRNKEAEQKAKEIADAERAIQRLQIDLMEEGIEKQIALANFNTNERIRSLKGSVEQIQTQTRLLEEQLTEQIISIRSKASAEEIKELRKNAQEKIEALVGSEEFVSEQIRTINEDLRNNIKESLNQEQNEQINILKASTEKRIASLTGSEEFIKSETIRLRSELNEDILQIQKEGAERLETQRKEILETELTEKQKAYKEQVEIAKRAREQEELLATQAAVNDIGNGGDPAAAEQNLKNELLQIELDFLQRKLELQEIFGENTTALKREIAEKELQIAQERIDNELKSEKNAQDQKRQIKEAAISAIKDIVSFQAEQVQFGLNQELAALEAQKQKEIEAVGENEEKRKVIEAKYQRQKEVAQKEAAEKQKQIAIVQTLINVAGSIVKTGSQLGYPLAIPFQVIAAAIGFKQIDNIRKQSFARGGATGKADINIKPDATGEKPVGIVHENEYVSPKWQYMDPTNRPIFDYLEGQRLRGYAAGGPVSTIPSDDAVRVPQDNTLQEAFLTEIRLLREESRRQKLVLPISQKVADLVQDETTELNTRRNQTLLG